ncbi:Sucrase/ferredoxin-like-domain-containing protein [Mycena rebaudengoi]|nr:Sucrase/ferredoxin-like-domain-containing protein [Mycena rebaudengoi]
MSSLRKLQAWAFGHELDSNNIRASLAASGVPVSAADCRTCSNPCEEGHSDYPPRFTVDMETQMLGTVRPFRRQILISTGKTDWDREITWTLSSLAYYISRTRQKAHVSSSVGPKMPRAPGVFSSEDSTEVSLLNASHKSISEDDTETVLVFPDFMVVSGVPASTAGAKALWETALAPARTLGTRGSAFRTWVLPYSCVIILCSHKRRDNRCAISAPKLEHAFTQSLQRRGWSIDTQLEHIIDPPLEDYRGTLEEQAAHIDQELRELRDAKKALILFNSHMGGHKFSGNAIIYTPNGSSVWYGRVTPHEVDSIVVNTIEGGLILPPLLRGGLNLSKPGCNSLHDW